MLAAVDDEGTPPAGRFEVEDVLEEFERMVAGLRTAV